MSCVDSLLTGIQAGCTAIKKVGGLGKRIYLGTVDDLATVTFGSGNVVTAITFKTDKGLVQYSGRVDKNSAGSDIEVGENVNTRNQTLSMSVYYHPGAQGGLDLQALDQLIDQEQVFAIVETRAGQLEVFGINIVNFAAYGLKVTANPGSSGVLINDSTAFVPVLSGGFTNLQLIYNPAASLATNIAALDALSIDPVPA
jgi:hypothetical protein